MGAKHSSPTMGEPSRPSKKQKTDLVVVHSLSEMMHLLKRRPELAKSEIYAKKVGGRGFGFFHCFPLYYAVRAGGSLYQVRRVLELFPGALFYDEDILWDACYRGCANTQNPTLLFLAEEYRKLVIPEKDFSAKLLCSTFEADCPFAKRTGQLQEETSHWQPPAAEGEILHDTILGEAIRNSYSQDIQELLVQRLEKKGKVNSLNLTDCCDVHDAFSAWGWGNFCRLLPSDWETLRPLINGAGKLHVAACDFYIEGGTCTKVLDCLREIMRSDELTLYTNPMQPTGRAATQWRDSLSRLITYQPTMKKLHMEFIPGNRGRQGPNHDLVFEALCNSKHRLKKLKLNGPTLSSWSKMNKWLLQGPLAEQTEINVESPSGRWWDNSPTSISKESLDALKDLKITCVDPIEVSKEWMEGFFSYLEKMSLPNLEDLQFTYVTATKGRTPLLASAIVPLLQKDVLKKLQLNGFKCTASETNKICQALKCNTSLISFRLSQALMAASNSVTHSFVVEDYRVMPYPKNTAALERWKDEVENWKEVHYLTDLNRFGRQKARDAKLSLEVTRLIHNVSGLGPKHDRTSTSSLVHMERKYLWHVRRICSGIYHETLDETHEAELATCLEHKKVGLIYGLLQESVPIWSTNVDP